MHLAELPEPVAYLSKHEAQMQYPAFQAAGWPIGDGAVETGNKPAVLKSKRQLTQSRRP